MGLFENLVTLSLWKEREKSGNFILLFLFFNLFLLLILTCSFYFSTTLVLVYGVKSMKMAA